MSECLNPDFPPHLCDPVTLDLLEDPIAVPCCGQTFSRQTMIQSFESAEDTPCCPLCRADLEEFDVCSAAKIIAIEDAVSQFKNQAKLIQQRSDKQDWTAEVSEVGPGVSQLHLQLQNSQFATRPSLFVAVCDRSGSMFGRPWSQVEMALLQIMAMARLNNMVKVVIVAYDHGAEIIDTTGTPEHVDAKIKSMFTGGGTNFQAAYQKVREVLQRFQYSDKAEDADIPNNVSSVNVAFLTDGQAGGNREQLITDFRDILDDCWRGPIAVHAIGFDGGCDRNLLEGMRVCGNVEGTFRYSDPSDDGDTLFSKFRGLFEIASKASTVPIQYSICNSDLQSDPKEIRFPINQHGRGSFKVWITDISTALHQDQDQDQDSIRSKIRSNVKIDSQLEKGLLIPIQRVEQDPKQKNRLLNKWISYNIDGMASKVMEITETNSAEKPLLFELKIVLLLQKVVKIRSITSDQSILDRIDFIEQQLNSLQSGGSVNLARLGDMRFGSLFKASNADCSGKKTQHRNSALPCNVQPAQIANEKAWLEHTVRYSRNCTGKGRNSLQTMICELQFNRCKQTEMEQIEKATWQDVVHKDMYGNNTWHLLAYCGHSLILEN
jgi:hypothetical protein